jgi:ABC-type multidrug transport system ATPase subunit
LWCEQRRDKEEIRINFRINEFNKTGKRHGRKAIMLTTHYLEEADTLADRIAIIDEGKRQRIAEMTDFLNEQSCELEEYDEQLVRRIIEKITVHDDKLTIEFKSGVKIDV